MPDDGRSGATAQPYDPPVQLLERDSLLAALREFRSGVEVTGGCMVFMAGEAGIGKSALTRAFCSELRIPVHFGFCDSLATPRALGPVHDIARTSGGRLGRLLATGADRHTIFTAFLDAIGAAPTVVVVEDAHWADEATLDLLLFVGRRIAQLPAVVVVTYRSEEVGREHPLRRVLGDLATARAVRRLTVPPLSRAAVGQLAAPTGVDGDLLHGVTGGNPFFVTEVLSAPTQELPATVRDAVLARVYRLGADQWAVVEVVALVPDRTELALIEDVAGVPVAALDDCVSAGVLVLEDRTVRFRHELARRAVVGDVPTARAVELHGRIVAHLATQDRLDPVRLAFHADAAGDSTAVLRHAPAAAAVATRLGANREAAAHYGTALRHAAGAPVELLAHLWERRATASNRTGELDAALDASARSIALWREVGDVERQAAVLARRSHMLWNAGDPASFATAQAAVDLLADRPVGSALAQACAAQARLLMLARDNVNAIAVGTKAIEYAERSGDTATLGWALNAVGSAHWHIDPARAVELLTAALDASNRAEDDQGAAVAMSNLGSGAGEIRSYALADLWLGRAVAWCTERDLDSSRAYALAWLARSHFEQGRWAEATATAAEVMAGHPQSMPSRIVALTVLGRLRVRRGDPDAHTPLNEAWVLAQQTRDLQRLWPTAAARAEAAWLAGQPERIGELVADTLELAVRLRHGWAAGELDHWRRVGGAASDEPIDRAEPYERQHAGEWAAAAAVWRQIGCPYDMALALIGSDDTEMQLAGLHELQQLGAWPAVELTARRLRAHGIRAVPRMPRQATRGNPAGLTDRQVEVLGLLAEGLRNNDIAARLHISTKTVDHHISAILAKLQVGSRHEAARWAHAQDG